MKAIHILTILLTVPVSMYGATTDNAENSPYIECGMKLGCGSTSLFLHDISIGEFTTTSYSPNSETDFLLSAFGRVNFGKFYVQSGLTYYNSDSSVDFQYAPPESDAEESVSFSVSGRYVQVPILFGYDLISRPPYRLSVFVGPGFAFPISDTYESGFSLFRGKAVENDIHPVQYKATAGLCVTVNHLLLDFGFDLEMTSQTDGRMTDAAGSSDNPDVCIGRSTGQLYFSLGFVF